MSIIATEIYINASPATVWSVLMDFKSYPEWNPFLKSINGKPKVGERLSIEIMDTGFKPTVLVCEEHKHFEWLGHLLIPGLFDGQHKFELIKQGDGTLLKHGESFKGLLFPLFRKKLLPKTKAGFELMNEALKLRVETKA
jgi:hypothetical protein